jgi:putative flippase GtrA
LEVSRGLDLGKTKFLKILSFALTFSVPVCSVNHLDIAPQYASLIMGLSNTVATVPGIISPMITGYIVQNKVIPFL